MDVSTLPGLPVIVAASAAVIAECVTGLLALFAVPVAKLPGFGTDDATRNGLMRALTAALNIAGLVGFAWSQDVVIPRQALPALLLVAVGQGVLAHFSYVGGKAAASSTAAAALPDPAQESAL